ncbi:hypothetical protein FSP39_021717 [Pinctada imbricata]|uniref:Uncharacterized protein n=1 Tax=Pinctada imbricata TaxID=66713 RepID=A0AA89C649_PINIB|nr:hypothetical protein FSP39_021717 [Pinctada imbricata]
MSKRKETDSVTPPQAIRFSRRRLYISAGMASPNTPFITLSSAASPCVQSTIGVVPSAQSDPHVAQPFLGSYQMTTEDGQSYDFSQVLLTTMTSQSFLNSLAIALGHFLSAAIGDATKHLSEKLKEQEATIEQQQGSITSLSNTNTRLENRILDLECQLEELEQYGRRTSLRFHNVSIPQSSSTDDVVVSICKDKLGVEITTDDINRSHPIGKPKSNGKAQIICRFRNWKVKNSIYSMKKNLKGDTDRIFITEDLTTYRQRIISEISQAKRQGQVSSFWTNDGRIFVKVSDQSPKRLIKCHEDLTDLLSSTGNREPTRHHPPT